MGAVGWTALDVWIFTGGAHLLATHFLGTVLLWALCAGALGAGQALWLDRLRRYASVRRVVQGTVLVLGVVPIVSLLGSLVVLLGLPPAESLPFLTVFLLLFGLVCGLAGLTWLPYAMLNAYQRSRWPFVLAWPLGLVGLVALIAPFFS